MAEEREQQYSGSRYSVPIQDYVEALVEPVAVRMRTGDVTLREYIERVLTELQRGVTVAEQEREKAARALREELNRTIEEGDRNLRDHIENQIQQIKAALVSAEALEVTRVDTISQRIDALQTLASHRLEAQRREVELITQSAAEAIAKADTATEKRFESVNEFRAQLSDAISQFMPREVSEAQILELRKTLSEFGERALAKETFQASLDSFTVWRSQVDERLNRMAGSVEGRGEQRAGMAMSVQLMLAVVAIILTVLAANHVFG